MLAALFPRPLPGIVTHAQPKEAVYLRELLTGAQAQIGKFDPALPGPENRMAPVAEGWLQLGVPALDRCAKMDSEWVLLDEIGYLECGCAEYTNAVRSLMAKKRVAAVVRAQDLPFLNELRAREDAFVVDLDDPFGSCGCVIMASGLGKRFGGNKLMADFHGQPMIARVLDATEGIFERRVVVTRHEDVAALCKDRGIECTLHDLPLRSDTVRLGLEAIGDVQRCMFCAGDQPLLRWETIAVIALTAANMPEQIWRAAFAGEPGSPVLFPAWAYPQLRALPEGKGGGYVCKRYPERVGLIPVQNALELTDADDPETLCMLLEQ